MNNLKLKFNSLTAKQKQMTMFGGVAVVVIGLIIGFSEEKQVVRQQMASNDIKLIDEEVNDFTIERLSGENTLLKNKVANLTDKLSLVDERMRNFQSALNLNKEFVETPQVLYDTQRKLEKLEQQILSLEEGGKVVRVASTTSENDFIDGLVEENSEDISNASESLPPTKIIPRSTVYEPIDDVSRITVPDDALDFVKNAHNNAEKSSSDIDDTQYVHDDGAEESVMSDDVPITVNYDVDEDSVVEEKETAKVEYEGAVLPAGTLIPGIVITGVDAPTGKAADKGAAASTIRISGPAILPNGKRVDLTGCFVTNDVRGDLATHRAVFRPQRITCSLDVGIVDTAIQGYVTGKDGSQGFRGKVVNKQGEALLYSATAGFIGGVGSAFGGGNNSQQQISLGSGGAYELPDPEDALTAGTSRGISDAAKQLADYYNEQLDLLYPIVEIKPMIVASIHLLQTVRLDLYGE